MSDNPLFEETTKPPVETTKAKGKHKRPMSEERKAALKLQLVKARAASLAKRQQKAKDKKLKNTKIQEVADALEAIPEEEPIDLESEEEVEEIIVKKQRKKVTRVVEETEEEMESRIEKRIREKLEREKQKELKEQERTRELTDLRNENEMLKSRSNVKMVTTTPKPSPAPVPQPKTNEPVDYSKFSTFGNNSKYNPKYNW